MATSRVLAGLSVCFLIFLSLLSSPSEAAVTITPSIPLPPPPSSPTTVAAPTSYPPTAQRLDDVPRRRIVGGTVIPMGEHSWMANRGLQCGGALIAPRWLVTGGHCTSYEVGSEVNINHWNVDVYEPKAEVFKVVEVVRYPGFTNMGDYDENDIALVRLSGASVTPPIRLITTAEASTLEAPGAMVWVAGWGSLSEDGMPQPTPSEVSLPVVANSKCADAPHYGSTAVKVVPSMMCAGYDEGGKDGCVGDSGGPLFARVSSGATVEDVLVGVVSFGIGCGRPNRPGIYTRISFFRDWINSVINTPPPPPTCTNMCGEYGNQACHCDTGCTLRRDCCSDRTASCAAQMLASQVSYCRSADACGRAVAGGSSGKILCYCHAACAKTKEGCCGDFVRSCPIQYGQSLLTAATTTIVPPPPATTPMPPATRIVPVPITTLPPLALAPRALATTKAPPRTTKPPTRVPTKKAATTKPPTFPPTLPPVARLRVTVPPTRSPTAAARATQVPRVVTTVGPRPLATVAPPGLIPPLQYTVPSPVSPAAPMPATRSGTFTVPAASPSDLPPEIQENIYQQQQILQQLSALRASVQNSIGSEDGTAGLSQSQDPYYSTPSYYQPSPSQSQQYPPQQQPYQQLQQPYLQQSYQQYPSQQGFPQQPQIAPPQQQPQTPGPRIVTTSAEPSYFSALSTQPGSGVGTGGPRPMP